MENNEFEKVCINEDEAKTLVKHVSWEYKLNSTTFNSN